MSGLPLSEKQQRVVELYLDGLTYAAIAEELGTKISRVRCHLRTAMVRLGFENLQALRNSKEWRKAWGGE